MYRSHVFLTSHRKPAYPSAARPAAFGVTLAAALLLSACAQQGGRSLAAGADGKPAKTIAHGVMKAPAPDAMAETTTASIDTPDTTNLDLTDGDAATGAPAATPAMIWHSADKLLGMVAEELQAALGAPARIRDEESGRIYQYVGKDCVLDLFLYQGAEGGYRVSYAEARSVHAVKKPVDACLKSLPAPVVADIAQPRS